MNRDHYRSAMDRLEAGEAFRQRLCEAAERRGQKRPAPPRLRWALPAACACLGLFAALWAFRPAAELPVQEASLPGEGEAVGAALPDGGEDAPQAAAFSVEPEESAAPQESSGGETGAGKTAEEPAAREAAPPENGSLTAAEPEQTGAAPSAADGVALNSLAGTASGDTGWELSSSDGRRYASSPLDPSPEAAEGEPVGTVGDGEWSGTCPEGSAVIRLENGGLLVEAPDGTSDVLWLCAVPAAPATFAEALAQYGGSSVAGELESDFPLERLRAAGEARETPDSDGQEALLLLDNGACVPARVWEEEGAVEILGACFSLPEETGGSMPAASQGRAVRLSGTLRP